MSILHKIIRYLLLPVLAGAMISIILVILLVTIFTSNLLDFQIYYEAAKNVLEGSSPYEWFGEYKLPYQYFPWISWIFIPLTLLPIRTAWIVYAIINLLLLALVFYLLIRFFNCKLTTPQISLMYVFSLLMLWLLFRVGQVSLLQLIFILCTMILIQINKPALAGIFFPFIIIKPHLVILMVPALWWKGGRKMIITSLLTLLVFLVISTILWPDWLSSMVGVFVTGQVRNDPLGWNFTTLASILGYPRLYNYLFAIVTIPIAAYWAYRLRYLPTFAWLSVVLVLSLLAAPYSFAYDLPLVLPALIWLTPIGSWTAVFLWIAAGLLPYSFSYSSGTYLLLLLIMGFVCWQAKSRNFSIYQTNGVCP